MTSETEFEEYAEPFLSIEEESNELRKRILNAERCRRYRERHPDRIEARREKKNERSREYQKIPEVRERRNALRVIRDSLRKGHEMGYASVPIHTEYVGNEIPLPDETTIIEGGKQKIVPYYLGSLGTGEVPTAKAFEADAERASRNAYRNFRVSSIYRKPRMSKEFANLEALPISETAIHRALKRSA